MQRPDEFGRRVKLREVELQRREKSFSLTLHPRLSKLLNCVTLARPRCPKDCDRKWFGVKVIAAKYESDDAQDRILEFYRREMKTYGTVTECRGDVDFRGGSGDRRVVCNERPSSDDVQLMTGTEDRQRVVAVKRRGSGSEFSLVYVNTRG